MPRFNLSRLVQFAEDRGLGQESISALDSFYFRCKLKSISPDTSYVYGQRLGYLLQFCIEQNLRIERLTKSDIRNYLQGMIDRVSPVTVNDQIIVLKAFYNHLSVEGEIPANPMQGIQKVKEPKTIKETLTVDDISKVLSTFNRKTFLGCRNFCLILLSFDSLLRIGELLSIRTDQLDLKSGLLKVTGKGAKDRYVGFSDPTAKALFGYVGRFRTKMKGEFLFCTRSGGQMEYRQAHRIFQHAGEKVGLHFYPHLSRHSGSSQFARSNGSIAILQKILGHSSLLTTQRYINMTDLDVLAAYKTHSPASGIKL